MREVVLLSKRIAEDMKNEFSPPPVADHLQTVVPCRVTWYTAIYLVKSWLWWARDEWSRTYVCMCVCMCVRNIYILFTFSLVNTFTTPVKKMSIKNFTLLPSCVTHHNCQKKYLALQPYCTSVWKWGKNYKRLYFRRTQVDDISNLRSNCPASVKTACQSQHPYRIVKNEKRINKNWVSWTCQWTDTMMNALSHHRLGQGDVCRREGILLLEGLPLSRSGWACRQIFARGWQFFSIKCKRSKGSLDYVVQFFL